MKKEKWKPFIVSAVAAAAFGAHAMNAWLAEELDKPILDLKAEYSSYDRVLADVAAADIAADKAWLSLGSRGEYDAYRKKLREELSKAIGTFDEKCPLNARTLRTEKRDGYDIEYVIFESHPGVYVTANFYVPSSPLFKPPYKAMVVCCGHSLAGKGDLSCSRMCVMAAQNGFACLVYDPIAQGERVQDPSTMNVFGHYRLGVLSALLGKSMALFRIWDGVRAMDYLDTRSDVVHGGYGIAGHSGGGTMTSLIASYDPRIVAAAPCCYISTLSDVFFDKGPQDCEQVIFGQLAHGLNHASFVLMGGAPLRIHACHGDFFPFRGTLRTLDTVKTAAANCSLGEGRYDMIDLQGSHGWREGARVSTVHWMQRHLAADANAPVTDAEECRRINAAFSYKDADMGAGGTTNHFVTARGDVSKESGFRSVYEILKDVLAAAEKKRVARSRAELSETVMKTAGIRAPEESGIVVNIVSGKTVNGISLTRLAFVRPDGVVLPAVLCRPSRERAAPLVLVDTGKRGRRAYIAARALGAGSAVLVIDLFASGEIGTPRRRFYGTDRNDEGVAAMLYSLGRSLVGERAGELLFAAKYMKDLTGKAPCVFSYSRMAIAAAHAYAARRDLVSAVEFDELPSPWAEAVKCSNYYFYAYTVNGALELYDWVDLLK